jgi:hypothetical protein
MRADTTRSRLLTASTHLTKLGSLSLLAENRGGLVSRQEDFVRSAIGQADAALGAGAPVDSREWMRYNRKTL